MIFKSEFIKNCKRISKSFINEEKGFWERAERLGRERERTDKNMWIIRVRQHQIVIWRRDKIRLWSSKAFSES